MADTVAGNMAADVAGVATDLSVAVFAALSPAEWVTTGGVEVADTVAGDVAGISRVMCGVAGCGVAGALERAGSSAAGAGVSSARFVRRPFAVMRVPPALAGIADFVAVFAAISHAVARAMLADPGAACAQGVSAAEVAFVALADFVADFLAGVAAGVDVR